VVAYMRAVVGCWRQHMEARLSGPGRVIGDGAVGWMRVAWCFDVHLGGSSGRLWALGPEWPATSMGLQA
jgi:hypothetical protein